MRKRNPYLDGRLEAETPAESKALLANAPDGVEFIDHLGQEVERLGETAVAVGPGYNNVQSVAYYLALLEDHETYGAYVIPVE